MPCIVNILKSSLFMIVQLSIVIFFNFFVWKIFEFPNFFLLEAAFYQNWSEARNDPEAIFLKNYTT